MSEKKIISVDYPLRKNTPKKWTDPEYRKEWNRQYRLEVKEGKREPVKRHSQPSKWEDKEFRRAYDKARTQKLLEEKQQKKMSFEQAGDKKPNYTMKEKKDILEKLLDMVKQGKEPSHPYYELVLGVKKEYKRPYKSS